MSVFLPRSQPAHTPAMTPHPVHRRKKLIEVALPLEAVSRQRKLVPDQKRMSLDRR